MDRVNGNPYYVQNQIKTLSDVLESYKKIFLSIAHYSSIERDLSNVSASATDVVAEVV